MSNSILKYMPGYPDFVGKRFNFACTGKGPTSYDATNKDILQLPGFGHYIDSPQGWITVSGNYWTILRPNVAGPRAVWKAVWYQAGGFTEVTNGTNLSAETFIVDGVGGQY